MSDDIDIEEHDVLDNPRIKNMFLDITSIKAEVIDYEESNEGEDMYSETMEASIYSQNDEMVNHPQTEDFSDYPQIEEAVHENADTSAEIECQNNDGHIRNMIVLGSRPCTSNGTDVESDNSDLESEPEIRPSSVVLVDWGIILEKNPCFCEDCKILFPTQNAIDAHRMMAHSFLVAVNKNTSVKSTSKGHLANFQNAQERKLLCSHCNKYFPDEDALLKHTYELIPVKFSPEIVKTANSEVFKACPVCSCSFKTASRFSSHTTICHNSSDVTSINTPFIPKCGYCSSVLSNSKQYIRHVMTKHRHIFYKKITKDNFECAECNLTFPTAYSEKIHRAAKHSEQLEEKATMNLDAKVIPKSNLFKCVKCRVHFVYGSVALEHVKRCTLSKGDWQCPMCQRYFEMTDRFVHTKQHEFTERFTVKVISDNLLKRILCRCLGCRVSFDERTFIRTHSSGCIKAPAVQCDICFIPIDKDILSSHKEMHKEIESSGFIIIDFVCVKVRSKSVSAVADQNLKEKIRIVYCVHCKCYMKQYFDYHESGRCRSSMRSICKLCGLTFTKSGMMSHKMDHQKFNLRLRHFDIYHLQTGKNIIPPFPEFKSCQKCNVHFFSEIALSRHACESDDHRSCGYCEKKFSDLALKLHIPFHEYKYSTNVSKIETSSDVNKASIPELLKKYESLQSIWNILYLCVGCDVAFDSYDTVVEHCQDHFSNMQSYNQEISHCDVCNLKMIAGCIEKHENLHMNSIDPSSFKILKFEYAQLMKDSWMNVFSALDEEKVKQILSKSIYRVTRNIRMELTVDGPADLTLYHCHDCNVVVEPSKVVDHANHVECPKSLTRYYCSVCRIDFLTENSLSEHNDLHKSRMLTKRSFRIISFRNKKDDYNNKLLKHMKSTDLKFIRCQYCGKLINKSQYKSHISRHVSSKPKSHVKSAMVKSKLPEKLKKPVRPLFKCRLCGVCVLRPNVYKHTCGDKSVKRQCNECNLSFRVTAFKKHRTFHELYGKFKPNVFYFKNCKVEKDRYGCLVNIRPEKNSKKLRKTVKKQAKSLFVVYQCKKCCGTVHFRNNIHKHMCGRTRYRYEKCKLCGLYIHLSHLKYHGSLHKTRKFSKEDITIIKFNGSCKTVDVPKPKSKSTVIASRKTATSNEELNLSSALVDTGSSNNSYLRLYECSICLMLLTLRSTFTKHMVICTGKAEGMQCEDCGLNLQMSSYKCHVTTQVCTKRNVIPVYVKLDIKGDVNNPDYWVYCCSECQIYYIEFKRYVYHIKNNHKKVILEKCNICNINFTLGGYRTHMYIHHKQLNIMSMTLNVEVLSERPYRTCKTTEEKNVKSTISKTDVTEVLKMITAFDRNRNNMVNTLYRCLYCDLHFINGHSLKSHIRRDDHSKSPHTCKLCNLNFTKVTLNKHKHMHKNIKKIEIVNFKSDILKGNGDVRISIQEIPNHNECMENKLNNEVVKKGCPASSENTKTELENGEIRVAIANSSENTGYRMDRLAPSSGIITSVQIVCENNRSESTVRDDHVQNEVVKSSETRLYKCSECDVFFLTAESCNDHCYNHTPLDPTEYIACKICELQFLCESLGKHMKGHREKTFSFDEAIVSEYQQNGSDIKIVTYSALDAQRLSNCVSTTTHFDMDC